MYDFLEQLDLTRQAIEHHRSEPEVELHIASSLVEIPTDNILEYFFLVGFALEPLVLPVSGSYQQALQFAKESIWNDFKPIMIMGILYSEEVIDYATLGDRFGVPDFLALEEIVDRFRQEFGGGIMFVPMAFLWTACSVRLHRQQQQRSQVVRD